VRGADHLLAVKERPKRKIEFAAKEKRAAYAVKLKKRKTRRGFEFV